MKKFRFSFFIPLLLASFCHSIGLAEFGNNNLVNEPEANSQKTREELIEGIRKRFQSVQGKMKRFEKKDPAITKNILPEKTLASSNFTYDDSEPKSSSDLSDADESNAESSNAPYWSENSTGMYFLPFFGLSFSSDLEWTPKSIPITIEQKNGFNGGFRLGYSWESLYLEHKTFYFTNTLEDTSTSLPADGHFSGFSTLVSAGLNFSFSDYVKWKVGGGVGATNQELDVDLDGVKKSESALGLTYQFSTGVELRPFEHFLLGFHYNWYFTPEFSTFSDRHLNSLELSLGYFH